MTIQHFAYIGLGSNLDDPHEHVKNAVQELDQHPQIQLKRLSPWYQSQAIGPEQPDYINGAALIATSLDAETLLDALQQIEQEHSRVRKERWGPRTLDLDILMFNNTEYQSDRLTIPHREMTKRNFVLQPLVDINSELRLPDGRLLADILNIIGLEGLTELPSAVTGVRCD